jgi:CRP-like cAMP-binding protein
MARTQGEVAIHGALVGKGCLRSYSIDNKGKEHLLQFAPEHHWITNLDSIRSGSPSTYFIDAIELSELFLIDVQSFGIMMQKVPAFAASFQTGIQKHAAAKDKRIIASLSSTAEERYSDFIKTYPTIAQRVPQHMLASYLGVTPETISRFRKKLSRKK